MRKETGCSRATMQRVGWVERSDTHRDPNDGDGLREALNPSYDLLPGGQITGRAGMAGLAGSHPVANDPLRNYARTG
jgi:hypothetical protein